MSGKTPSMYSDRCKVAMHLCVIACWQFLCNCLIGLLCLWPVSDNTVIFSTADKLNEHTSVLLLWVGPALGKFCAHLAQREPTDGHLPLASLKPEAFAQLCPNPSSQMIGPYYNHSPCTTFVQEHHLSPISVQWVCSPHFHK